MKYPKIYNLYRRDEKEDYQITKGEYSKIEFGLINRWLVTEKIDCTNIRILWDGETVRYRGRTDNAQVPTFLLDHLQKTFTSDKLLSVFGPDSKVILYGEGYGNKIQKVGSKYRKDTSFILFDAVINGWWLDFDSVQEIAQKLSIKTVPVLGIWNEEEIYHNVYSNPYSTVSDSRLIIEGVIARSYPMMLFRDGTPIKFKLKVKDVNRYEYQRKNT